MLEDASLELAQLVRPTQMGSGTYEAARRDRVAHPRGFEPGVKYDTDGVPEEVVTPPVEHLGSEDEWNAAVEAMGFTIPDGYRLRLIEAKYDPAAWHRENLGEDAVTKPVWRYKFAVEVVSDQLTASSIEALVKEIGRTKPRTAAVGGAGTFVVAWNDWQLFKATGDGIEGTVARIYASFDATLSRVRELRKLGRLYPRLVVVASGDIVEGCSIFQHQAWELQGDSRDQENAARRLIVSGLKAFAPYFEDIQVLVVGGNHGENRQEGRKINRKDNTDCKVFEQAADVLAESDYYSHISFAIPADALSATMNVEGWVLGVTHGHIAGRGSGGAEAKLHAWFKGQAGGKTPVGDSHVLVTSHFHHARYADWGGCLWMQAPTMDGGSPFFSDMTGEDASPGLLTFGMTETERMRDYEITAL